MIPRRSPAWYVRRFRRFQPGELRWRLVNTLSEQRWRRRWSRRTTLPDRVLGADRAFAAGVGAPACDPHASEALIAAAAEVLAGRWTVLGVPRHDLRAPDWSDDAFEAPPDDLDGTPATTPSTKHMWELSRGHVLTVLATAYRQSGDERYATRCGELLDSWWRAHASPAHGQWASVEVAERLISWVWVRRLLDGWSGAPALFERNPVALRQLYLHQELLARFPSRFSSANNHRVAEAAGLLTAACAFPWFASSGAWRARALAIVEDELHAQVHECGLQREPAIDYHCFVLDLALVSLAEAAHAGAALRPGTAAILARMADALVAIVDQNLVPPRHGDSDESQVAQLDGPWATPAVRALSLAAACVGPAPNWPAVAATCRGAFVGALAAGALHSGSRAPTIDAARVARDAGVIVLRRGGAWASLRAGPFGYLPIGSHTHADLLAVELRLDGEAVLVDPGTYVYEMLPGWRRWLRSTAAHNTVCVEGADQADYWGAFLWGSDATAAVDELTVDGHDIVACRAHHDGYRRLPVPTVHRRAAALTESSLTIVDRVEREGGHTRAVPVSMTWLFGPDVALHEPLDAGCAATIGDRALRVTVPAALDWEMRRGAVDGHGWMSARFGVIEPTWALVGTGAVAAGEALETTVSWSAGVARERVERA